MLGYLAGAIVQHKLDNLHQSSNFTNENKVLLENAGVRGKHLVRLCDKHIAGPYRVAWKQSKRSWFGCEEKYYACKFLEGHADGTVAEGGKKYTVLIAAKVGLKEIKKIKVISTEGHTVDDCVLHFGYTAFTADTMELFFVIHPNAWGPFQNRFREVLEKSTVVFGKIAEVAGALGKGMFMGAVAVAGPAGALAGAAVGFIASDLADRNVGDYLRYIGPGPADLISTA